MEALFCQIRSHFNNYIDTLNRLTTCFFAVVDHCIVGSTKVWVRPMKNITQKPPSLFPDEEEAVLVR